MRLRRSRGVARPRPGTRFAGSAMGASRAALMPEPPGTWPRNGSDSIPPLSIPAYRCLGQPGAGDRRFTESVGTRTEYEPYGQVPVGGIADRPGYTGHVADALTDMDYMQQRYYDPMIGRFLSTDPVTWAGTSTVIGMGMANPYRHRSRWAVIGY
ncbi:MAG: RHS repeat-associated core domain-containing protein [Lysobacterales bacterium]